MDVGIATASMVYQAAAEGLGTCIIGWVNDRRIRKVLSVPSSGKVELVISVGYTDNRLRDKSRKPPGEVITFNKY
jgi:nitroreductase